MRFKTKRLLCLTQWKIQTDKESKDHKSPVLSKIKKEGKNIHTYAQTKAQKKNNKIRKKTRIICANRPIE